MGLLTKRGMDTALGLCISMPMKWTVKLYLDDVLSLKRGGCLNLDSTGLVDRNPVSTPVAKLPIHRGSRIGFVVDTMPRSCFG